MMRYINLEYAGAVLLYIQTVKSFIQTAAHTPKILKSSAKSVDDASELNTNLFDVDANLLHSAYLTNGITLETLLDGALKQKVTRFFVPGSSLGDSRQALDLSQEYSMCIYASAGIHPYHAADPDNSFTKSSIQNLKDMLLENGCLAVGECGLDYSEGFPAAELQKEWFKTHVDLACQIQKPLFLHSRNAHTDFVEILNSFGFRHRCPPPVPGLVHCFTETIKELEVYLNLGFYIGLTGHVINNPNLLKDYCQLIPLDKLMVETDAPYMGFSGCRDTENKKKSSRFPNVPASLPKVVAVVADAMGLEYDLVAHTTTKNALNFFRILPG